MIKMMGKSILKIMALGLAQMALILARVMAPRALDWL
jgi:hypothetical protein